MTLVGKYVVMIKNAYSWEDSFYKNVNKEMVSCYPTYRVENELIYVILAGEAHLCIPAKSNEIIRAIMHDFHETQMTSPTKHFINSNQQHMSTTGGAKLSYLY